MDGSEQGLAAPSGAERRQARQQLRRTHRAGLLAPGELLVRNLLLRDADHALLARLVDPSPLEAGDVPEGRADLLALRDAVGADDARPGISLRGGVLAGVLVVAGLLGVSLVVGLGLADSAKPQAPEPPAASVDDVEFAAPTVHGPLRSDAAVTVVVEALRAFGRGQQDAVAALVCEPHQRAAAAAAGAVRLGSWHVPIGLPADFDRLDEQAGAGWIDVPVMLTDVEPAVSWWARVVDDGDLLVVCGAWRDDQGAAEVSRWVLPTVTSGQERR